MTGRTIRPARMPLRSVVPEPLDVADAVEHCAQAYRRMGVEWGDVYICLYECPAWLDDNVDRVIDHCETKRGHTFSRERLLSALLFAGLNELDADAGKRCLSELLKELRSCSQELQPEEHALLLSESKLTLSIPHLGYDEPGKGTKVSFRAPFGLRERLEGTAKTLGIKRASTLAITVIADRLRLCDGVVGADRITDEVSAPFYRRISKKARRIAGAIYFSIDTPLTDGATERIMEVLDRLTPHGRLALVKARQPAAKMVRKG